MEFHHGTDEQHKDIVWAEHVRLLGEEGQMEMDL